MDDTVQYIYTVRYQMYHTLYCTVSNTSKSWRDRERAEISIELEVIVIWHNCKSIEWLKTCIARTVRYARLWHRGRGRGVNEYCSMHDAWCMMHPILWMEVVVTALPSVPCGVNINYWHRTFSTVFLQIHFPSTHVTPIESQLIIYHRHIST
jgi:hypothetical protein